MFPRLIATLGFATVAATLLSGDLGTAEAASGDSISGRVVFTGEAPRRRAIRMDADPACAALHTERVLADNVIIGEDNGLANVFIYLVDASGESFETGTPEKPVQLQQQGCQYLPRVQGIRVKQTLEVLNTDPTLHNVRSLATTNRPFNMSQPAEGKRTKFFTKVELPVKFKCDVHSWMTAYLFVLDHPFFTTTDSNGRFTISGLGPGDHTLIAWHEEFGEQRIQVNVGAGDDGLTIEYSE